jgi:hypothetical protein
LLRPGLPTETVGTWLLLLLLVVALLLVPLAVVETVAVMIPTLGASEEVVVAARDFLARLVLIFAKEGIGPGGSPWDCCSEEDPRFRICRMMRCMAAVVQSKALVSAAPCSPCKGSCQLLVHRVLADHASADWEHTLLLQVKWQGHSIAAGGNQEPCGLCRQDSICCFC